MKKSTIVLGFCLCAAQFAFCQLKVSSSGNVGIQLGTSTPISALSIGGVGSTSAKVDITGSIVGLSSLSTGTSYVSNWTYGLVGSSGLFSNMHIGILGQCYTSSALNSKRAFGILGIAGNSSSGYNYGVFGTTYGSQNGAGIVGTTENDRDVDIEDGIYAGYFVGDVKVTGLLNGVFIENSDSRYKKNIVDLGAKKALKNVLQMLPIEYNLNQISRNSKGDSTVVQHKLYKENSQIFQKKHYGLIAQDLQKLYPDLVYENKEGYLSVNYTEVIPLLIQSVKELKSEIDDLSSKNNNSAASANAVANSSNSSETDALTYPVLDQNTPNPFTSTTAIGYYLPTTVASATIYVYDMAGVQLKNYPVSERGKGNLTIQGSELNAGMYLYTLIADGKVIDSKRMILTK